MCIFKVFPGDADAAGHQATLSVTRPRSVVPASEASVSPGSLLEMQILRPHSSPTESETLGVRPSNL